MAPSLDLSHKDSMPSTRLKVSMVSIRVWLPYGADKCHTPWWSSLLLRTPSRHSISTFSLRRSHHTQRVYNWLSLSFQVTLLVSSALLFLTQLILWCQLLTREEVISQLVNKLALSIRKLALMDYGLDLVQESLWLVLWPVYNGGFMIPSR